MAVRIIFEIVFLCVCMVVLVVSYDMTHVKVVHYRILSKKIEKNVRIALVSDLHNASLGEKNQVVLNAIDREKPDVVVSAGDLVTSGDYGKYQNALALCQELVKRYPFYYGLGNHETKIRERADRYGDYYQRWEEDLQKIGVSMLHNQVITIPNTGVVLYGLELPLRFFVKEKEVNCSREDIQKLVGVADSETFNLLIGHNPEFFEAYMDWGADLVVSGHQHGGIVRIPFLGGLVSARLELFPKYDGGLFSGKNGQMIISRGLGTHTIPIRFHNPCELVIIDLLSN